MRHVWAGASGWFVEMSVGDDRYLLIQMIRICASVGIQAAGRVSVD